FFFSSRRRHTRSKRDWSSDVCSSDLAGIQAKKTELNKQEEQIQGGKTVLKTEMDKARAQLESGEETLNEKISELDSAKEEAFKRSEERRVGKEGRYRRER